MAGWIAPLKAPSSPKPARSFHSPKTTGRIDLGFPPLSHCHINRGASTRNEEVPSPQPSANDFRKVLRKKHAAGPPHSARMTGNLLLEIKGIKNLADLGTGARGFHGTLCFLRHRCQPTWGNSLRRRDSAPFLRDRVLRAIARHRHFFGDSLPILQVPQRLRDGGSAKPVGGANNPGLNFGSRIAASTALACNDAKSAVRRLRHSK